MATPRVIELFRYPVKGMRPEALNEVLAKRDGGLDGDRAFAFQFLDEAVPEALRSVPALQAPWMPKMHLAVQHDWPELARVVARWNAVTGKLCLAVDQASIEERVDDLAGRDRLAAFVRRFMQTTNPYFKSRRSVSGEIRLLGNAQTSIFTDGSNGFVSLALMESLLDLEQRFGPIDRRRFRLNLHLSGAPAWSELAWAGRELRIGECRLRIVKSIGRCPNIDVDPDTGVRCVEVFPQLKSTLGHAFVGVRCTVLDGGIIRSDDRWEFV